MDLGEQVGFMCGRFFQCYLRCTQDLRRGCLGDRSMSTRLRQRVQPRPVVVGTLSFPARGPLLSSATAPHSTGYTSERTPTSLPTFTVIVFDSTGDGSQLTGTDLLTTSRLVHKLGSWRSSNCPQQCVPTSVAHVPGGVVAPKPRKHRRVKKW